MSTKKAEPDSNGGNLTSWMIEQGWADTWAPLPRSVKPDGHKPSNVRVLDYELTEEDLKIFNTKGYWVQDDFVLSIKQLI